jgi:S-formylglutathione hydrolase FrmB
VSHPFPTLETSHPDFERDGVRHATVFSAALGRRGDCTLWAPAEAPERLPLVVLLHGVYGSHWAWTATGGAHRVADQLRTDGVGVCALAMPSDGLFGHGSGYLDHRAGRFESWIVDEVPQVAEEVLGCVDAAAPFALAGLSMGGFGALTLGARHGDRVTAAAGMSSITDFEQMSLFVGDISAYDVDPGARSVLGTVLAHRDRLPAIHLDCGRDDPLIEQNRDLHAALVAAGIDHEWVEHDGGHEWPYWKEHIASVLGFCLRQL